MKDIAIYGAGGLGREVACMINAINEVRGKTWNIIGFFDDGKKKGDAVGILGHVLGGIAEINSWPSALAIACCFGSPETMRSAVNRITNQNISFPNVVSTTFYVAEPATFGIGRGNIVKAGCSATCNVTIGDFNIFNGDVCIGHDVSIGDCNVIMPGARISGEVSIGNDNLLGADCFIKQQLKIGNGVVVSPLSALLTKPKNGATYIGNPAKIFKF